jgi:uncharacterized protein
MELGWSVGAGVLAGLASAPHCLAMCGPLAAFASRGEAASRAWRYHAGRALAYSSAGAIAGATQGAVLSVLAPEWISLVTAVLLSVALLLSALRLAGLDREPSAAEPKLVRVSGKRSTPFAVRLLSRVPKEPFVFGAATVVLPCAALYTGLLIAASAGSAARGAMAMGAFATASSMGLLAASWVARRPMGTTGRRALAFALAVGAVLTLVRPIQGALSHAAEPNCHAAS